MLVAFVLSFDSCNYSYDTMPNALILFILRLLDWAGPGQGQVADACECGNEPLGSIKCGEFLD